MAISAVSATTLREAPPPRRQRLLEDERWLAFVLLVPTLVLLGMFIAYPFVRGILLSVTNTRVGVPGDFVGLANFYKIFNDGIFRTSVYNTFLYTGVTTVFKLALGLWLAMLQTISPELNEAAAIDGAKPWQRFWHITWPLLLPVTMVVVLFSVIQTFADFQIVYVMTGGGPANATHLFATYAYQISIGTGLLSEGAAISLAMFPVLFLVVIIQLLYIRRVEVR